MDEGEQPWEVSGFPWDERPGDETVEPTALELVWNMKSWEVIADKGKETLHMRGFLIFYWTDPGYGDGRRRSLGISRPRTSGDRLSSRAQDSASKKERKAGCSRNSTRPGSTRRD